MCRQSSLALRMLVTWKFLQLAPVIFGWVPLFFLTLPSPKSLYNTQHRSLIKVLIKSQVWALFCRCHHDVFGSMLPVTVVISCLIINSYTIFAQLGSTLQWSSFFQFTVLINKEPSRFLDLYRQSPLVPQLLCSVSCPFRTPKPSALEC